MCSVPFTNHKTFAANFVDPLGFLGGKKGFLGTGLGQKKNDTPAAASTNAAQPATADVPNVQNNDPSVAKKALQVRQTLLEDNSDADSGPKLY